MSLFVLSSWTVADLTIRYLHDPATGGVALQLLPTARLPELARHGAPFASGFPPGSDLGAGRNAASGSAPLVRVGRVGDRRSGAFAQGRPPRFTPAGAAFRFAEQALEVEGTLSAIVTTLADEASGHWIEHRLSWHRGDRAFWIDTAFLNDGDAPVTLEALSSFSLGGLTPFDPAGASGRLRVHRFRSAGSGDARPIAEAATVEQLCLEHSRSGDGFFRECFGPAGASSARRRFPFVALEDSQACVTWAAQLGRTASWQMELSRQGDGVCLSGGLATGDSGRWARTLVPGEAIDAPPACLACVAGDLDAACERLAVLQQPSVGTWPAHGASRPILFD